MSKTVHIHHPLHQVAVWIDHREAILVIFEDAHLLRDEEIFSEAGPHTQGGGWSQKRIQAHRHALLDHFYEEVIHELAGADEIILYGPGQAKYGLHQHIARNKALSQRVIDLVTTSKVSENQLVRLAVYDLISAHKPSEAENREHSPIHSA